MMKTYQTVLPKEAVIKKSGEIIPLDRYLSHYAEKFGNIERALYVALYRKKEPANETKKRFCRLYQITSRQYNSVKIQLEGKVRSVQELNHTHLETAKEKLQDTEKKLAKKEKALPKARQVLLASDERDKKFRRKVRKYRNLRHGIHQLKRKRYRYQGKIEKWEEAVREGKVRICFGSRKLFLKQFHLEQNGWTFSEWKEAWRKARASQVFYLGSKDERYGNQTCQRTPEKNLHLRVDKEMEPIYGATLVIPDVSFSYGEEALHKAICKTMGWTSGGKPQNYYRAVSYRMMRCGKHWRLNASIEVDATPLVSVDGNGAVGVDYNVQHLAVAETDRFGNYLSQKKIPFRTEHTTNEQREQSISEALEEVFLFARAIGKPVAMENLDFEKKKRALAAVSKKDAKRLHAMGYRYYQNMAESKAHKYGIQLEQVSPAYTSQIGKHCFMKRYGLSIHTSAALVIARRSQKFNQWEAVPKGRWLKCSKLQQAKRPAQWRALTSQWKRYTNKQQIHVLEQLV